MPTPSAKRALFTTPTSRAKRAKTTRTVVVRAKEESKFDDQTIVLSAGANATSLISAIAQGDGQGQRIGSKLRVLAVECRYDFVSGATFGNDAAVIRLVIPKDPSAVVPGTITTYNAFDPTQFTVLHEEYISPGGDQAGMFRWKGPLNCGFNLDGSTVLKNNLYIQIYSMDGNSGTVAHTRVWYTG